MDWPVADEVVTDLCFFLQSQRYKDTDRMITADQVKHRFLKEAFSVPLLDNTMRGVWCEYMVAEALGGECRAVGLGWNAWDLQIGEDDQVLPDRIRIQVKNNARIQPWNAGTGKLSDPLFTLPWRRRPGYFENYMPNVPCEPEGFLCDVFILCHHPVEDEQLADHREPGQWECYVLPTTGPNCAITASEVKWARGNLESGKTRSSTQRTVGSLRKGIRGRPPIESVGIEELSVRLVRDLLCV
jgi:hypothetical protein